MSDFLFLAAGVGGLAALALYARALSRLQVDPMVEALIGLVVAVALAVYLIVTLVRPERF